MRSFATQALLAGLLGLGVTAGLRAQDPRMGPAPAPATPPKPVVTEVRPPVPTRVTPEELLAPDCPAAAADAVPKRRPIRDWLASHGCWADINTLGCGSLRQELRFIFGSCREFFGESCQPNPPNYPILPPVKSSSGGCNNCR
jgi:hypothetical protein